MNTPTKANVLTVKNGLIRLIQNDDQYAKFLSIFKAPGGPGAPGGPLPVAPPATPITCDKIRIPVGFDVREYFETNRNIWILTVVTAEYSKNPIKTMRRGKYIRTFILYNLTDGKIIPCLMPKGPGETCKNIKTLNHIVTRADAKKNGLFDNMKIINLCNNYYNILGTTILEEKRSDKNKKNKESIKKRKSYIKGKSFLNIHLYDLNDRINADVIHNIQEEVITLLKNIESDPAGLYQDKINKTRVIGSTNTQSVKLLKFTNKLKISTTWFNPRGNLKEFKGVVDGNVKINRSSTWSHTTSIIKKMDIISQLRFNNNDVWKTDFSKNE